MLSNKIWITRKIRIYTEKRLNATNTLSNIFVVWYSFILVCFSVWNLLHPNDYFNIFLVFGSIAVLIASIVVSAQKYIERSLLMRNCYIELDKLYSKTVRAEENKDIPEIEFLESEYASILQKIENHSDFDFLCFKVNARNDPEVKLPSVTISDWIIYISSIVIQILIIIFLLGFPLFFPYLWGMY